MHGILSQLKKKRLWLFEESSFCLVQDIIAVGKTEIVISILNLQGRLGCPERPILTVPDRRQTLCRLQPQGGKAGHQDQPRQRPRLPEDHQEEYNCHLPRRLQQAGNSIFFFLQSSRAHFERFRRQPVNERFRRQTAKVPVNYRGDI